MSQAGAAEAAMKVINGSCVRKAEADMELLSLVSGAASANYDAPFTVERVELLASVAEASGRQFELD